MVLRKGSSRSGAVLISNATSSSNDTVSPGGPANHRVYRGVEKHRGFWIGNSFVTPLAGDLSTAPPEPSEQSNGRQHCPFAPCGCATLRRLRASRGYAVLCVLIIDVSFRHACECSNQGVPCTPVLQHPPHGKAPLGLVVTRYDESRGVGVTHRSVECSALTGRCRPGWVKT